MKLETGSRLVTLLVVLLSLVSIGTILFAEHSIERRRHANQRHHDATMALHQFMHGSEALTDAVRAYVVTGDERYRIAFEAELTPSGWRDQSVEQLQALLGDAAAETVLIHQAKRHSDALVEQENRAMATAERGDRDAAIAQVFGAEYRAQQATIMELVELALKQLDTRQAQEIAQLSGRADIAVKVALTAMLLNALGILAALLGFYQRRVVAPLARLTRQTGQLLTGARNVRFVDEQASGEAMEIAELARTLDAYQQLSLELDEQRQELQRVNEEQQAIFDTATSGMALIKERILIRCNRRLHEMFGWAPGGNGRSTDPHLVRR
jgi:hypothetical protein